jgi:hypothetical protein
MRAIGAEGAGKAQVGLRVRSWLVLASLFVQLIATSGHFHREDFAFLYDGTGETVALAATSGEGAPSLPGGGSAALAHDDCSLCFNLQIAQFSALPLAVAVAPPRDNKTVPRPAPILRRASIPHLLFLLRASPVV